MTHLRTAALALLLLAASAPAAQAASYAGKTRDGAAIRFTLKGTKVSAINTTVPASCVESTGSGATRAGVETYRPPGAFPLGRTTRARALQPAAMNRGTRATKNYAVTVKRAGAKVSGTLKVNYSFLAPGADIYHSLVFICQGSTRFAVAAR